MIFGDFQAVVCDLGDLCWHCIGRPPRILKPRSARFTQRMIKVAPRLSSPSQAYTAGDSGDLIQEFHVRRPLRALRTLPLPGGRCGPRQGDTREKMTFPGPARAFGVFDVF